MKQKTKTLGPFTDVKLKTFKIKKSYKTTTLISFKTKNLINRRQNAKLKKKSCFTHSKKTAPKIPNKRDGNTSVK